MSKVLKMVSMSLISIITWPIITLLDVVTLVIMCITKVVRMGTIWLSALSSDEESCTTKELVEESCSLLNPMVNEGYKYYIDLMYPEETEEESE